MRVQTISCCVIAQDEAPLIAGAVDSVAWCDQVIVVDGGSSDGTQHIARQSGATVFHNPWPGFASQRNFAIRQARGDWILELDCDERVTPELADEIRLFLSAPPVNVDLCLLPMQEVLRGRTLRRACRYPFYRPRLFRRQAHWHSEDRRVHEGLVPTQTTAVLHSHLTHLLGNTYRDVFRGYWHYAFLEAEGAPARVSALSYLPAILARPLAKTVYRLVLLGAAKEGIPGLVRVTAETSADALRSGLVLCRQLRPACSASVTAERSMPASSHLPPPQFPPRIVAIARDADAAGALTPWLQRLARLGADAHLVLPWRYGTSPQGISTSQSKGDLFSLARHLDGLRQIGPIDALAFPRGARRWPTALLPPGVREAQVLGSTEHPEDVIASLHRLRDAR